MKGFRKVRAYPTPLKSSNSRLDEVVRYWGRVLLREEIEQRLGYICDKVSPKELFVCWKLKTDVVVKEKQFTFDGETRKHSYELTVPTDYGPRSS